MCEHVSEAELLLALDGELAADRDNAVWMHRHVCGACEEKWTRLADLSREVTALQCPEVSFRPEDIAVTSLIARVNDGGRKRIRPMWLAWANTLAAVAIAAICIVALPTLRVKDRTPATYDFDDAVPAGYTSLPYADPALPLDDTAVLPVELSADNLELMGIDAAGRTEVKAEILLGMDGWPRAIRMVDQE